MNLAMELGLYSMLPAAFYDLCRHPPSRIVVGTVSTPPVTGIDPVAQNADNTSLMCLSPDFLFRTLLGRECCQHFVADFIEQGIKRRRPSIDCVHANNEDDNANQECPCRQSFYYLTLNILRAVGGIADGRDADALYTLIQATEMLSRTDFSDGEKQCSLKICTACKNDFSKEAKKAREEVWASIPKWFGLGS